MWGLGAAAVLIILIFLTTVLLSSGKSEDRLSNTFSKACKNSLELSYSTTELGESTNVSLSCYDLSGNPAISELEGTKVNVTKADMNNDVTTDVIIIKVEEGFRVERTGRVIELE